MNITTDTVDATSIEPISHREAFALAEEQYRRFVDELASLGDDDWGRPTDCEGWDVRAMAGHVLGAMRAAASLREQVGQQREIRSRAKATGENEVDVMTSVQIERTADLGPAELVIEARSLVRPAAVGRKRTPLPMRKLMKIPVEIGSISETWKLGYLVDTILTRDIWMHRIDLARATDRPLDRSGSGTARVVADIVGEWARRHGRPFDLTLTGDAGGRFAAAGPDPEVITVDAVEFCRVLSGRGEPTGLLCQEVPF